MSRYSRQELFAGIGPEGQKRLRASRVLVVGCGALGSALSETMVRAGVGGLTVVDRDYVEPSNLHRQSLFDEEDARRGLPKAAAAEARLRRLNSEVEVRGLVADVSAENADTLVRGADLVLDGTDNFETRYLINASAPMAWPCSCGPAPRPACAACSATGRPRGKPPPARRPGSWPPSSR